MRFAVPLALAAGAAAALAACSGESGDPADDAAADAAAAPGTIADPGSAAPEDDFAFVIDGPQIYDDFCDDCHGTDGAGVATVHPPLVGSSLLAGEIGPLVHFMVTLEYPDPPPPSALVDWTGGMGATAYLSDDELAAVLTYARESFTDAGPVTAEDVAAARQD